MQLEAQPAHHATHDVKTEPPTPEPCSDNSLGRLASAPAPRSQPSRHQLHHRSYEEAIASAAGTVVPLDMRCRYKTGRCPLARATKRSGRPLLLCEFHRAKQNSIKRKSDTKYRIDRLAQKARNAMDRPLQTQAQLPVDFDKCLLLSNPLHIPIVPLAHDPLTPLQQLISPTSDMGGDDIALLQFFVLTPR
ncbi:hypothetical protein H310_12530 [Aphanomyces invadans]|uniref:Uncharacterized protein n=1 Tax=Aphanomyces invadans TaxID=157072 RepID=A0A024THF3_9STRA|nr:hypothetical protein H310_12530 [Aphanomyces invadans]ETV93483.1 hypothetical protein H310_12530 [Aphanomyces invadans]|eukprot:XP_008877825.1 hypothetical protein H310_12530 [Aphanomyces invadans]